MKVLLLTLTLALGLTACNESSRVIDCIDGCSNERVTETKTVTNTVEVPVKVPVETIVEVPVETVVEVEKPFGSLTCKVYDLSAQAQVTAMPNFSALTPAATLETFQLLNLKVGETDSLSLLKGTPVEGLKTRVGIVCTGKFKAAEAGTYNLSLYSDDGSELLLEGINVLSHGGLHSYTKKSANVILDAGSYDLTVRYFQNFGEKGLTLTVKRPGVAFEELVDSSFLE